jgi:hypothetical protein
MGRYDALLEPSKAPEKPHEKPENLISGKPDNLKAGIPESILSGKPENLKTRKQEREPFVKAEKYSTQLDPSIIKQIKQYAIEHDIKDYVVVQTAIKDYLERKK